MKRSARFRDEDDDEEEVLQDLPPRRIDLDGTEKPNFVLRDITLTVRHRAKLVRMFDRLSAVFPRGRNVAVLGDVDDGAAHLIRLLTGVENPRFGSIDRNVKMSWPMSFFKYLMPDFSLRENVVFIARLYAHDTRYVANFVRDLMQITTEFDRRVLELSAEQRKMFALSLSLAIEFECYILGAPMNARDEGFVSRWNAALDDRLRTADIIHVINQKRSVLTCMEEGGILSGGKIVFYESVQAAVEAYKEKSGKRRSLDDDDDDDMDDDEVLL